VTEDDLTAQIQAWTRIRDSQPHEVAAKFLCEARSFARSGKVELAEKKIAAAYAVVKGNG
jgi:hypothetical protein